MRDAVRRSFAVVMTSLALAGCGPTASTVEPPTTLDARAVVLADLQSAVDDVVVAQQRADPELAAGVAAIRRLNVTVGRLRDPATVYEAREEWPVVAAGVDAVAVDGLRPPLRTLAFAVDDARLVMRRASDQVADEEWEVAYLAAADEMLLRMRDFAATGDALAQILERHAATWRETTTTTNRFVTAAWFYRDGTEAAGAYEIEIGGLVDRLATAAAELDVVREEHRVAGEAVNDASREASERFRAGQPTSGGAG